MTKIWILSLFVGLGGFIGSILRYWLSIALERFSIEWPLGTLSANILGCLFIGIITALSIRGDIISIEVRLALVTGFCGGLTTMSSMIYETSKMLRANEYLNASIYALGSVFLSLLFILIGIASVHFFINMNSKI